MWKTINYEVCGRGHIVTGTPCQDKTLAIDINGVHGIALADGAGSAKYSHFGAEVAIRSASEFIAENFDALIDNPDGNQVKKIVHHHVKKALEAEAQRLLCEYKDLASTLLLVAIKENRFLIFHVGDGVIGYLKNSELLIASDPDNGEYANTTVFLTSPNAIASIRLFKGEVGGISGFVLMSDGTSASFYHKKSKTLASAVKKIINWTAVLSFQKMHSLISNSFNDIITMKTQDDCSIAVIALSSQRFDEYFKMSTDEKCELLGINNSCLTYVDKQIARFDTIIHCLSVSKTLEEIADVIQLKPKYTKKLLVRLADKGIIE